MPRSWIVLIVLASSNDKPTSLKDSQTPCESQPSWKDSQTTTTENPVRNLLKIMK